MGGGKVFRGLKVRGGRREVLRGLKVRGGRREIIQRSEGEGWEAGKYSEDER